MASGCVVGLGRIRHILVDKKKFRGEVRLVNPSGTCKVRWIFRGVG